MLSQRDVGFMCLISYLRLCTKLCKHNEQPAQGINNWMGLAKAVGSMEKGLSLTHLQL